MEFYTSPYQQPFRLCIVGVTGTGYRWGRDDETYAIQHAKTSTLLTTATLLP